MTDHGAHDVNPQKSQYLKHLYRGSELLLNDRIEEAREVLEEASRIDPEDPKGLSLLGLVYFRLEEFERAQQIYEMLVGHFPMEASLRVNLGLVYMKQGHAEAARQEMLRAVEIDANHQRAYGYLGLLYSESGEHDRARVAFAKAGQDAMVQRMDELLSQQAPDEVAASAPGAQGRPPAQTQEVWAEPELPEDPGVPLEPAAGAPAAPTLGAPPPVPGAPSPGGAMTPMMSDAMTQPIPMAPWSPGAMEPEFPAPVPGAQLLDGAPDLGFPEATLPDQPVLEGLAPEGETAEAPDTESAAEPPQVDAAPAESITDEAPPPAEDAGEDEELDNAFAAVDAWQEAPAARPEAGPMLEEDVSAALDRAVGPEEPWPAGGGPMVPPGAFVEPPAEAVLAALPAAAGEAGPDAAAQPTVGHREPTPIFAFATTELVDLGARHERMVQISESLLLFPVEEDGYFRAESLMAEVGDFRFESAFRRAKGGNTVDPMGDARGRFLKARGEGVLLCDAGVDHLVVLDLYDDFIYLRSEYLFAFESTLHWENGKIRGQTGPIQLLHIRGEGRLALACAPGLRKIRLVPDQPAFVAEAALIGWVGRVIPQTVPRPVGEEHAAVGVPLMRCEGEGVLLIHPAGVRGQGVGQPAEEA